MTSAQLVPVDNTPAPTVAPEKRNEWIELMTPAAELAGQIAGTNFVPHELRNNPAAITACILYGSEIGIGPMQSLAKVDIVKGRPAPRAELGRALALAAGHEIWTEESTTTRVTVKGRRRNSSQVQTVTWTMDDAKNAGLAGNPSYKKFPRQMLLARASAELVRSMCPDVLGGVAVFAEEAEFIDDGDSSSAPAAEEKKTTTRRRKKKEPEPEPEPEPAPDEQPAAEAKQAGEPDGPTDQQTRKAMPLFEECGIDSRDDRLGITAAMIGRTVDSWGNVTRDEARQVIDQLEQLQAGTLALGSTDDGAWTITPIDTEQQPALPEDTA